MVDWQSTRAPLMLKEWRDVGSQQPDLGGPEAPSNNPNEEMEYYELK